VSEHKPPPLPPETRSWVARAFTLVEDVVYIGLGVLLAGSALGLLVTGFLTFVQSVRAGTFPEGIVALLDRILLILLIVELLYTVQVSFRAHALVPEPFLLVGLISAIRRVLVVTAEFGELKDQSEAVFRNFITELGVLTVLIVALAFSLLLLHRRDTPAVARRE
jgi:uncharacterized membrane protein (DUF373 family)